MNGFFLMTAEDAEHQFRTSNSEFRNVFAAYSVLLSLKCFAACANFPKVELSYSDAPRAKAPRTPSSECFSLCGLCVFARDIPNLVAALPR
jgi:hypothetical protein